MDESESYFLHEIIDLERVPLDDVIPDGKPHWIYLTVDGTENVNVVAVSGPQWDFMYWIYRLQSDQYQNTTKFTEFLNQYLTNLHAAMRRRKDKDL